VLKEADASECLALQAAVRADPSAMGMLRHGASEVSIFWTEGERRMKSRLDWVGPGGLVDLKTCRDASPRRFASDSWARLYHAQLALYRQAWAATHGGEIVPVHLIAVESAAPYVVQVYRLPEDLLESGLETVRELLARLAECEKAQSWPGYHDGVLDLGVPRWASVGDDEGAAEFGLE
jgi:exodeoxyribonuclease VIII